MDQSLFKLNAFLFTNSDYEGRRLECLALARTEHWADMHRRKTREPEFESTFIEAFEADFRVPYDPEHEILKVMSPNSLLPATLVADETALKTLIANVEFFEGIRLKIRKNPMERVEAMVARYAENVRQYVWLGSALA